MNMEDIVIDESVHTAIGMKMYYGKPIERKPVKVAWQKDELFNPKGITVEDAHRASEMCS